MKGEVLYLRYVFRLIKLFIRKKTDVGIGDSSRHPQALQGLFAYFQERADLVAVHPHVFLALPCRFHVVEDVVGNGGNLVVQLLVGFGLECYYFHNGN